MVKSIKKTRKTGEEGNVFFYIFLCITLIGMLTYAVSQMSESQTSLPASAQQKDQVARLMGQTALLSGAIQQMIVNGNTPADVVAGLVGGGTTTGGNNWDTAPNNFKIYHPYGGGVKYMGQTGSPGAALDPSANIANNFQIRTASAVTGVGDTNATVTTPDLLFTAQVASAAACQLINTTVLGWATAATPPTINNIGTAFANLFTNTDGTTNATVTTINCTTGTVSDCSNLPRVCVQNTGTGPWGYYQVLLAE